VKRPFEAQVAICWTKNGELLTKKDQVHSRWKEHFQQHLNEGEERDQPQKRWPPVGGCTRKGDPAGLD
jgi:hypothetical protein